MGDGEQQALLRVRDVHAFYGLAHVLHGVSLDLRQSELTALLGRNGAGKTTTLRSIMGLFGQKLCAFTEAFSNTGG